jgi:superfamily II DNA/RNA helicase
MIQQNDILGAPAPLGSTFASEADTISPPNGFERLGLAAELVRAVADLGYTEPTVVQQQTISRALSSEATGAIDLMVSSQTGSGKTAAFLLPVLHTLLAVKAQQREQEEADWARQVAEAAARGEEAPKRPKRKDPTQPRHFKPATPAALVVCPTRELAQQVAHDAIELVKHCKGIRVANVVGGMPYQLQVAKLQGADLVVATPGRLLDLERSKQIKLDAVRVLVVDEADRMLDLGFADDLAEINRLTSAREQTMMFSATFAPRIQQLAMRVMHDNGAHVQRVQVDTPQERHANIEQKLFWADSAQHKRQLLEHWLRDASIDQAIVFASTQVECDALANDLQQDGFSAVALHGALSQGLRNRRLMALRNGQVQILVATDVAARGIDVPTITHVFNFGLPMKAEDYTHRIGRTGRAGRDGLAVTFAEFRDRRKIFDIEAYSRQTFQAEVVAGLEPTQRAPSSYAQPRAGRSSYGERPSRERKFGSGPTGRSEPARGDRFKPRSAPGHGPRDDGQVRRPERDQDRRFASEGRGRGEGGMGARQSSPSGDWNGPRSKAGRSSGQPFASEGRGGPRRSESAGRPYVPAGAAPRRTSTTGKTLKITRL